MILRSLSVRNIRSYTAGTLTLAPGTTLITGDVGAGKTSLLYAAEMALFGFAEVEAAYLVRNRARHAEVTLELADGAHRYEFRRKFRRKTIRGRESFEVEENSFGRDGSRIQYSATELRQRSIDLLGFPDNPNPRAHSDVWRWAVYIPQERMRDVLGQEPEARLDTVRKALGLEQFRLAADNAQEVAAELRRIAEMYEREAEQLRFWVDELPKWTVERATRARELETLRDGEARCRAEREAIGGEVARLEGLVRSRDRDRAEGRRLAAEIEAIGKAAALRAARAAETERTRSELEAQVLRAERDAAERRRASEGLERLRAESAATEAELAAREPILGALAEVDGDLRAIRLDLARREREIAEASAEESLRRKEAAEAEAEEPLTEPAAPTDRDLALLDRELARSRAEREALLEPLAGKRRETADLTEILEAGTCPRCHQPVAPGEFEAHLRAGRAELELLETALLRRTEEVARWEAERAARDRYERELERYRQLDRRRRELRTAVDAVTRRRIERSGQREAALEELARAEARRRELLPRSLEIAELRQTRDAQRAAREALELSRAEALRLAEEARGARVRLEDTVRALERGREEAAEARERVDRLQGELAACSGPERDPPGLDAALVASRRRLAETAAELERSIGRVATTSQAIDEADRRILEADRGMHLRAERLSEADRARRLAGWMGREFRDGLLDLERRRLAQSQAEFNRAFARYFRTLVEDPNLAARCDAAFAPWVEIDGETTPAAALSGGERTALALSYRLAMGRTVRSLGRLRIDTLILDEPTDGFSPEQVVRMGDLLAELDLPQVLLISHESQLAGIADRVIRIVKEPEGSRILSGDGAAGAVAPAGAAPAAPEPDGTPDGDRTAEGSRSGSVRAGAFGTPPDPTGPVLPPQGSR